jgi:hypothetical protein
VAAVHCSKCGEELLGAVNRCWKCGQMFALPPEMDGRPPVRTAAAASTSQPLEAIIVDELAVPSGSPFGPGVPAVALPAAAPRMAQPRVTSTAELIEARRAGLMAMGGTVTSLVLGLFSAILSAFWPPGAIVAVLGLVMGIWGLSSPRRNWALVGMLLCCLAIGLGTFGMARGVYIRILQSRPIEETISPDAEP